MIFLPYKKKHIFYFICVKQNVIENKRNDKHMSDRRILVLKQNYNTNND